MSKYDFEDLETKEQKTLEELCIRRKKDTFQQLKAWDQSRATKLFVHRKVCDQLDQSLQNKLQQSNGFLNIVKRFLCDVLQQKKKYQQNSMTDPAPKLSRNSVSKNVHVSASRVLNKLYLKVSTVQNNKNFSNVLQDCIKQIQNLLQEGQKEIMDLRTKMQLIVVEVQNKNLSAAEACEQLMNFYSKDKNSKAFKAQNDFLTMLQQFMTEALDQNQTQRSLGKHMLQYIHYMQKFEEEKVNKIKQILQNYMNICDDLSQDKLESLQVVLKKNTQGQYLNDYYSPQDLLEKSLLSQVCQVQGRFDRQRDDINILSHFLQHLEIPIFENRNLILKEYRVFCKNGQELQEALIIISIDAFLNVLGGHNSSQNHVLNFEYSFKLDTSIILKPNGDISLLISSKKKKFMNFIRSAEYEELQLIFSSEDQRDEFCGFTEKLMN